MISSFLDLVSDSRLCSESSSGALRLFIRGQKGVRTNMIGDKVGFFSACLASAGRSQQRHDRLGKNTNFFVVSALYSLLEALNFIVGNNAGNLYLREICTRTQ